MMTSC